MKIKTTLIIAILAFPLSLLAQEENDTIVKETRKLERAAFESYTLIENQSSVVNTKGTLDFMMQHRFGMVNGTNNMIGIWGAANIRIGVGYSLTDRLGISFGTTRDSRLQDFALKGAILRQTRDNHVPVNVTYYGNAAYNATTGVDFDKASHRWSFFNQLIISRRFNSVFSMQVAPSLSHANLVKGNMENNLFAVAVGGKVKITPSTSLLIDYSQPITKYTSNSPKPGVGIGGEFSTGSHAFQLFITNYKGILPQQSYMNNQNDFFKGDFMIGFNITRLWHM